MDRKREQNEGQLRKIMRRRWGKSGYQTTIWHVTIDLCASLAFSIFLVFASFSAFSDFEFLSVGVSRIFSLHLILSLYSVVLQISCASPTH